MPRYLAHSLALAVFAASTHPLLLPFPSCVPADTSPLNRENVQKFGQAMKTVRMLVNTPASQGAIGDIYSELQLYCLMCAKKQQQQRTCGGPVAQRCCAAAWPRLLAAQPAHGRATHRCPFSCLPVRYIVV